MGIRIALDDFGTGHSALSDLTDFPFDEIKIDRSFVPKLNQGKNTREVFRHIVRRAHILEKTVVVEGLEAASHVAFVQSIGVRIAQNAMNAPCDFDLKRKS